MAELPTEAEFAQLYPDDYYSYVEPAPSFLSGLKRILEWSYNRHRYVPQFSRLLEIGPGRGKFLQQISSHGEVVGLERSAAASKAAQTIGVQVVTGNVEDASLFPAASFDVIYSNHAFEHLPDPNAALASMARWLKPGGEIFIAVPNIAGAVARLFGKNWYYIGPPLHVTNSTPDGLRALLAKHGFAIQRVEYNSDPISIPMSAFIACGGSVNRVSLAAKLAIGTLTLICAPLVFLLDKLRLGDCIEVHATKQ